MDGRMMLLYHVFRTFLLIDFPQLFLKVRKNSSSVPNLHQPFPPIPHLSTIVIFACPVLMIFFESKNIFPNIKNRAYAGERARKGHDRCPLLLPS